MMRAPARRVALVAAIGVAATGGGVAAAAFRASTSSGPNGFEARPEFPPRLDSVPDVFGAGQVGQTLQASAGAPAVDPLRRAIRRGRL